MALQIRRLTPKDDRSGFRSGTLELDLFFQKYAGQNQFRHHLGITYVAIDDGVMVGFVTVVPSEIGPADAPASKRKRPHGYTWPVLRLARLAVDERARGRGIGKELMAAVFALAHQMAERFGCTGVVVDAKPSAVAFYEKYGFEALEAVAGLLGDRPEPTPMFLELGAIPKP